MNKAGKNLECGDLSPLSSVGDLSPTNAFVKAQWPHAPVHELSDHGIYIVTAGCSHKQHFFNTEDKLTLSESKLLELANHYQWQIEAWAVFPNHYHFVARGSPV